MSTIQRRGDNGTELRLDYEDISAGQLVIVIEGLPTADGSHARISPTRSNFGARNGSPSSPLIEEADAISDMTAYAPALGTSLVLAAWRGQETRASELIAATIEDATAEDEHGATALAEYARAVLCNGLGRYQDALTAAERACAHEDLGPCVRALLELIEAGARSNTREIASEGMGRLEKWARTSRTEWALGVGARSAALLSEGDQAEDFYRQAIERLARSRGVVHLARARLLYGEWLRRENRRSDAREQLRCAHDTFSDIGADAFAERARRELLATGETARTRSVETRDDLTPQEAHIARLARDGLSNSEIGARLYISPRTVQYHLRKVFLKLDITSRNQLGRVLPAASATSND